MDFGIPGTEFGEKSPARLLNAKGKEQIRLGEKNSHRILMALAFIPTLCPMNHLCFQSPPETSQLEASKVTRRQH